MIVYCVKVHVKKENIDIIGLPEGTGIYLENSIRKIIGSSPAFLFSKKGNKKVLKVGKTI